MDYVTYFVISLRLILQMCAGISDVILYAKTLHHLNKAETVVELVIFRKFV